MAQTPRAATARRVRMELAARKITGRALADGLGWSFSTTARRLAGTYPFTIDELAAVAQFIDMPLRSLLGDETTAGAA